MYPIVGTDLLYVIEIGSLVTLRRIVFMSFQSLTLSVQGHKNLGGGSVVSF